MRRISKLGLYVCVGLLVACEKGSDGAASSPAPSSSALAQAEPSSSPSPPPPVASVLPAPESSAAPAPSAAAALPAPDDAGTGASAAVEGSAPKAKSSDAVRLLAQGKAPLAKLRYRFEKDRTDRLQMTTASQLSMLVADKSMPAPAAPGIRVVAALTVRDVHADGSASRDLALEQVSLLPGPGLDADMRRQAEANLREMQKVTGKDRVDARGFVQQIKLDASKVESPEMRQALGAMQQTFDQMGAPFPEQSVGIGGKWQVKTKVEQMGIRLEQVAVYELLAHEADKGKIKVSLKQSAPRGKMKLPGLPPGASAEMVGMAGTGTGELAFDLARGVPEGNIDTDTEVKVEVLLNGEKQQMTTRLKAKVKFKPLASK